MITASVYRPTMSTGPPPTCIPASEGDHGQERRGDVPAQERRKAVAEHDPDPVRRREQQPAGEAALEVARDAEAR